MKKQLLSAEAISVSANKAWQQALGKVAQLRADVVPVDYKSRGELQVIWGVRRSVATTNLQKLTKLGLVETKRFKIMGKKKLGVYPRYKLL